jgi:hypothetical protein
MTDLIHIQHSHVTQLTKDGIKGDWSVQKNKTNEELYQLPAHLSDSDIFTIMKFVKKFELEAFNAGIQFQKALKTAPLQSENAELRQTLQAAVAHGDRLAAKLQSIISKED